MLILAAPWRQGTVLRAAYGSIPAASLGPHIDTACSMQHFMGTVDTGAGNGEAVYRALDAVSPPFQLLCSKETAWRG